MSYVLPRGTYWPRLGAVTRDNPALGAVPRRRRRRRRARPHMARHQGPRNFTPAASNLDTPVIRYVPPREYVIDAPLRNPLTMDGLGTLIPTHAERMAAIRNRRANQPIITKAVQTPGGPVYVTGPAPLPGEAISPEMARQLPAAMQAKYASLDPTARAAWDVAHEKAKQEKKERDRRRRMGFLKNAAMIGGGVLLVGAAGPAIIGAAGKGAAGVGKGVATGAGKLWGAGKTLYGQIKPAYDQGRRIYGKVREVIEEVEPHAVPIVKVPGTVPLPPIQSNEIAAANNYPSGGVARRTGTYAGPAFDERHPGALDPDMGAKLGQGALIVGGIVLVVGAAAAMRGRR